jgi:hypothetical protein
VRVTFSELRHVNNALRELLPCPLFGFGGRRAVAALFETLPRIIKRRSDDGNLFGVKYRGPSLEKLEHFRLERQAAPGAEQYHTAAHMSVPAVDTCPQCARSLWCGKNAWRLPVAEKRWPDMERKDSVLVYVRKMTEKNAHGNPSKQSGNPGHSTPT